MKPRTLFDRIVAGLHEEGAPTLITDPNLLAAIDWQRLFSTLLVLMTLSIVAGLVLLGWVLWRVRRIHLPPDADFVTALQATPLVVAVLLDLLDFGLDFLSIPIAWVVLGRLGLAPLRGVTILEEFIPGTQMIPTMTVAWFGVRLLGRGRARAGVGSLDTTQIGWASGGGDADLCGC